MDHGKLSTVVTAIRRCYLSEGKSDSSTVYEYIAKKNYFTLGQKDKALIQRIIQSGHTSTIEHLVFSFDIYGLSRAALQELARHRHASLSVQSTRYTLGELKKFECLGACTQCNLRNFMVQTSSEIVDESTQRQLCEAYNVIRSREIPNDQAKYMLPESFKTSLIWTINARSLRNFLQLRSSSRALWEMQKLANMVYTVIPQEMKFMFDDCMEGYNG